MTDPDARSKNSMGLVVILQPYVPAYRVALFDQLSAALAAAGLRLLVAHGVPLGDQVYRADADSGAPWSKVVGVRRARVSPHVYVTWSRSSRVTRDATVVICELSTTNLTTWRHVICRPKRVILWGHGASYVGPKRRFEEFLECVLVRRAAHTMTYVDSGRASLISRGVRGDRVTAIGNSTDTAELRRLKKMASETASELQLAWKLPARSALFVGGLDAAKRIDFLLAAARARHEFDNEFALVVGGSGAESASIETVRHEPWIRWIPRLGASDLAALSDLVESIWMPGRVGLVAVDALAVGLPILTTSDFRFHAPEFEYLEPGTDVFLLPDNPTDFARRSSELAIQWSRAGRRASTAVVPTIDNVVQRMTPVIYRVTQERSRSQ
jgi:glycosyltransferase involved in cell wall biosynthesis